MSLDLYSPTDVKTIRKKLYEEQQGVDPILQERIQFSESVMDHDHTSQHCRAALHRQTNAFEGLCFNAYRRCLQWLTDKPLPEILRNLATYLEQDYSDNPYHNGWIKRVTTDFNKLKESEKDQVLELLGQSKGNNSKQRVSYLKSAILSKEHGYEFIRDSINQVKGVSK